MAENCPYCREKLSPGEGVQCPGCQMPHHLDCWRDNGGCTVFGCGHAPVDEEKIAVTASDVSAGSRVHDVGANSQIFVNRSGQQLGPYDKGSAERFLRAGILLPTDLAWADGMAEWLPLSRLIPLAPKAPLTAAPAAVFPGPSADILPDRPRFGRGAYILSLIGIFFVGGLLASNRDTGPLGLVTIWGGLLTTLVLRLRDVGDSGWMVLCAFVPGMNVYIYARALVAPRDYAITKKADTAMRVVIWTLVGLFVLGILVLIFGN